MFTQLKIEQQRSEAKIDAKKSQDVKFLCDVCQVGFTTKEEESEHRNQHKQVFGHLSFNYNGEGGGGWRGGYMIFVDSRCR